MLRDTPNFTYNQELACPACGGMVQKMYHQDNRGRYKQYISTLRRPVKKGPWGNDDVLEDVVEKVNAYTSKKKGKEWVHKCEFMCSKCGVTLSRGQCVPHEFADDELPFNFWEKPDGVYIHLEEPKPTPVSKDIYGIDTLF